MNILCVHERWGALGGAESNLLAVAGELRQRGHAVGLLHGAGTGVHEESWREVFQPHFPLSPGRGAASLAAAQKEFRPDVIFLHKLADLASIEALATGGVPVVRMVHDHDLICMRSYRYHPLTRSICTRAASAWCVFPCGANVARQDGPGFPLRWVSYAAKQREIALNREFAGLIVASDYMQREMVRNGFAVERIAVHAPVPRECPEFQRSSFSPRNLIVYSGQIVRGKGVDVLLDALARLSTPFEAVLFGDGSHRAACERRCRRLGLQSRVHFAGFVSQAEIRAHYSVATVAVISSVWPEPFGAVGLEAMRCGLPVVGFDAGGIREWLADGDNGFLVPWMDRAGYARRLDTLLRDKTLARAMGERGREIADTRFGFADYVSGLETRLTLAAGVRPEPLAA